MARRGHRARKPTSREVRAKIITEQMGRCAYCNASLAGEPIEWDHFIPHAWQASNANENYVAACRPCNQAKKARYMASEADLTAFCLEMVKSHGSFADGWPDGAYFEDLTHSEASL
jgi:hypothetical protein